MERRKNKKGGGKGKKGEKVSVYLGVFIAVAMARGRVVKHGRSIEKIEIIGREITVASIITVIITNITLIAFTVARINAVKPAVKAVNSIVKRIIVITINANIIAVITRVTAARLCRGIG